MEPILNIENLTKTYGTLPNQTKALDGIAFQVMPGEFLGIMEAAAPESLRCSTVLRRRSNPPAAVS